MTYTPSPGDEEQIDYSIKEPIYDLPEEPTVPQVEPIEPIQEVDAQGSSTGAASDTQAASTTEASAEPEQSTDTEDTNFDMSKPFEYYEAQGMTRSEWSRKRMESDEFSSFNDLSGLALATETAAKGVADTVSDTVSFLSGGRINIPKFDKYENEAQQAAREISGFIIPELVGVGAINRLGRVAHARLGWGIGNNAWVRRFSELGIDVGTATALSSVKAEGAEAGNAFDLLDMGLQKLPGNWDWVTRDLRSGDMDPNAPDLIRQRNIQADGLLMGLPSLIGGISSIFSKTRGGTTLSTTTADVVADGLEITGGNAKSSEALKRLDPVNSYKEKSAADIWNSRDGGETAWDELPQATRDGMVSFYESEGLIPARTGDPAEIIVDWALDNDSALDELGRYNVAKYGDLDVPLKGVNDLYDYNEIGMRTVDDFGIVGASIDQARIANNAGTSMGRLRNMISPAAMKYAGDNLNAVDDITLGFTKELDDIDSFSVVGNEWSLSMDDILKAGDDLVVDFFDPTLDVNGIRRLLGKNIKTLEDGTEVLTGSAYGDIFNQVVKMGKSFNNMTIAKAQAYVGTSLAGQLSDAAEMARLNRDSPVAIKAAQERIKDNMKYLLRLKGSTNFYRNYKNSMANMFDPVAAVTKQSKADLRANYKASMDTLNQEINQFVDELDYSFKKYPELGEAIMELYELTDGRVYGIETINDTLKKSFGWSSPFKAQDPNTPNLIGQAVRANWFSSNLSATATPNKAFIGNIGGIIEEPISYFAGALMRWDMESMKKGMFAYRALGDVKTKALPLMRDLFKKASQNVKGVELATDLDYAIQIDNKLQSMRKLAAAEADRGNIGTQALINEYIALQEIAQHPAMKFSSNAMTGLDGLPQSVMANGEARFRAIEKASVEGITDVDEIKRIANSEYNSMFDGDSLLTDKAAKYAADAVSLRLNTPLAQGLNEMTQKFPWTRLFFPYPGTQANIFNIVDSTIPLPFRSFQQDINELAYRSMDDFAANPNIRREILERKGYDVNTMDDTAQLNAIIRLKNKTLGRKGITTVLMGSVSGLYFKSRITGEGIYNKEAQAAREKTAQIPKNSVMGPDGRWYSYMDLLGPGYGRWVSTFVTALENANYLGSGNLEDIEKKLAMVFGGILEEDSGLSALVPLVEMAQGNAYAMQRWSAGMLNSLGPLSGLRNEMGNLLNGGLRIVDGDIKAMIANRNKALGLIIPGGDLPKITNPLDGTVPNEYNPIMRLFNNYSPVKMTTSASENQLFLNDIGYSYTTMFKKKDGVDLEPKERERLFELVAEDQQFNRDVTRIRKMAERTGYIEKLRIAKANGASGEELEEYLLVQKEIRDAAKLAEEMAFARLDYKYLQAISNRVKEKELKKQRAQIGAESFIQQVPTR